MAVDALTPCITRTSAAMISTWINALLYSMERVFQLSAPFQYGKCYDKKQIHTCIS